MAKESWFLYKLNDPFDKSLGAHTYQVKFQKYARADSNNCLLKDCYLQITEIEVGLPEISWTQFNQTSASWAKCPPSATPPLPFFRAQDSRKLRDSIVVTSYCHFQILNSVSLLSMQNKWIVNSGYFRMTPYET